MRQTHGGSIYGFDWANEAGARRTCVKSVSLSALTSWVRRAGRTCITRTPTEKLVSPLCAANARMTQSSLLGATFASATSNHCVFNVKALGHSVDGKNSSLATKSAIHLPSCLSHEDVCVEFTHRKELFFADLSALETPGRPTLRSGACPTQVSQHVWGPGHNQVLGMCTCQSASALCPVPVLQGQHR